MARLAGCRTAALIGVLLAAAVTSCSSSTTGGRDPIDTPGSLRHGSGSVPAPVGTTPGSNPVAPAPEVDAFDAPAIIPCPRQEGDTTAPLTYRTSNAARVFFLVDGAQVKGSSPPTSGTFDLPLPCDGRSHVVVLTAVGADGRTALRSKAILTGGRTALRSKAILTGADGTGG